MTVLPPFGWFCSLPLALVGGAALGGPTFPSFFGVVLPSRAAFDGSAWRHLLWGCAAFFRLLWVELPFFLVG